MNSQTDIDRILGIWLAEGPDRARSLTMRRRRRRALARLLPWLRRGLFAVDDRLVLGPV